jgi:hypothetical protein
MYRPLVQASFSIQYCVVPVPGLCFSVAVNPNSLAQFYFQKAPPLKIIIEFFLQSKTKMISGTVLRYFRQLARDNNAGITIFFIVIFPKNTDVMHLHF